MINISVQNSSRARVPSCCSTLVTRVLSKSSHTLESLLSSSILSIRINGQRRSGRIVSISFTFLDGIPISFGLVGNNSLILIPSEYDNFAVGIPYPWGFEVQLSVASEFMRATVAATCLHFPMIPALHVQDPVRIFGFSSTWKQIKPYFIEITTIKRNHSE